MSDITVLLPQTVVESSPVDLQTRRRKIHCKQELIVMSLQAFYAARKDIAEVMEMLQGTSVISLRLIDWFVTNYSKRHNIGYVLNGQEFMVYMSYKSQLKAYSKKLFDPFCRRERIMFSLPTSSATPTSSVTPTSSATPGIEPFVTTVGKLNFFRWAIEKNIIEYLKLNRETVETEMNTHMKQLSRSRSTRTTTSSTGDEKKRVRTAFQTSPPQTLCRRDVEIKVGFD